MFTLQMKTDLSQLPKIVETNIDEIAPMIGEALAKVEGLVVDEAGLTQAKADAAEFRKMADKIASFRKEHIKLWKDPMAAFETKCKDYEKRLTEAARDLTDKCNEIIDKRKQEKREAMHKRMLDALDEKLGEPKYKAVREAVAWENWFAENTDTKTKGCWLNAMFGIDFAYNQTLAMADKVLSDLGVLSQTYGERDREIKQKAYLTYCQSFDLSQTLCAVTAWDNERKALAEAREADRKAAEAAEASAQASAQAQTEQTAQPQTQAPQPQPESVQPKTNETAKTWLVRVTGTCSQMKAIVQYARSLGVTIENAKKSK